MKTGVYATRTDMGGLLPPAGTLPPWRSVLMVSPEHFTVAYAINPHMRDANGELQRVDPELAGRQWDALRKTYEAIGYPVHVLSGEPELPDMVFAANQTLPYPTPSGCGVVLSRMRHPQRELEVGRFASWFRDRGHEVCDLGSDGPYLEGCGDLIWVPGRRLLLGGYGHRTERAAVDRIAETLDVPIVALRLMDERFYHLDTCVAPIDARRALWVPGAFDEDGAQLLNAVFPGLIEVPEDEAVRFLACNAHCPDGRNVLIDEGAVVTRKLLEDAGLRVHPIPTSEFLRSGGSVFCLKQTLF